MPRMPRAPTPCQASLHCQATVKLIRCNATPTAQSLHRETRPVLHLRSPHPTIQRQPTPARTQPSQSKLNISSTLKK
ncbi:hypothetical protein E2C01_093354 [Portunus trituberculatus]|uniref:Uncharacterized protein n=1 Tax=Portunus trituberculatus TaxID=210409 RepID=A0A5B7K0A0_PORTR|nr:hypothetical protein [Portunus trituberculatus]